MAIISVETFLAAEASAGPLDEGAAAIIRDLSSRVTAPEYVRTPQFARRGRTRGPRSGAPVLEWSGSGGAGGDFKATVLQKREGMEGVVDRLRKHINKMSEKTAASLSQKAFDEIDSHEGARDSVDVSAAVFELVSSNAFYSTMYANFYGKLLARYPAMRGTLEEKLAAAPRELASVGTKAPKGDYDAFCKQNKLNAIKRATGKFYVTLAALGVVDVMPVVNVVAAVQQALLDAGSDRDSCESRDELTEILFHMLVGQSARCLHTADGWPGIRSRLSEYAAQTPAPGKGVTGKSIFRHMDIVDSLSAAVSN